MSRRPRNSSIFFARIVGVVFMRVNATCVDQVRPPLRADLGGRGGTRRR
jgi:hypothetical protein